MVSCGVPSVNVSFVKPFLGSSFNVLSVILFKFSVKLFTFILYYFIIS